MEYKFNVEDVKKYLTYVKQKNIQIILVDANPEQGFNYPYLIYIPKQPQNTLIMDCLNDYEEPIAPDMHENASALKDLYELFSGHIISSTPIPTTYENQENKETTSARLGERFGRAFNTIATLVGKSGLEDAPIMVPIIPGYINDTLETTPSELSSGTVKELAPQIVKMIKNAQQLVSNYANVKLNEKIIAHGHSKSATFANNFTTLYPEFVEATMLSGLQYATLPINEIKLKVVSNDLINENEEFELIDGIPQKRITQTQLNKIIEEYKSRQKPHQFDITYNEEDKTYTLPLNYPLGTADITHYRELSKFPLRRIDYLKVLSTVPKMLVCGENEEQIPGHFAYSSGTTLDGISIDAGDDLHHFETTRKITEIERAGMHNRVLEYKAATSALFGRSANERFRNYSQLCKLLNLPVQQKIYEGVGHVDLYASHAFGADSKAFYEGIISGITPTLDSNESAPRINPIYQLIRRYSTLGKEVSPEAIPDLVKKLENYLATKEIPEGANIDKILDNLTAQELADIFEGQKNFSEYEIKASVGDVPVEKKDSADNVLNSDINKDPKIKTVDN